MKESFTELRDEQRHTQAKAVHQRGPLGLLHIRQDCVHQNRLENVERKQCFRARDSIHLKNLSTSPGRFFLYLYTVCN